MLPDWKDRAEITANLLNPAFCNEIIRECASGYKEDCGSNMPFTLVILILPVILNNTIRARLPKNKSNTIHGWLNSNEDLKVGLANSIKNFIPFTKETLMFGIAYESLSIDENGGIEIKKEKKSSDQTTRKY
ncbi:three component ABC system middle component [Dyadobacter crusticola]|uniref:three component ABC system middle component n=1 Tax=Dyadobacter crusticola TaxID=292407 RepID=UPI0012F9B4D2|nr:three component ABC system middle component [Dyadobacter crusticola]